MVSSLNPTTCKTLHVSLPEHSIKGFTYRQATYRRAEGVKHPDDPRALPPADVPQQLGLEGVSGGRVVPHNRHGAYGILEMLVLRYFSSISPHLHVVKHDGVHIGRLAHPVVGVQRGLQGVDGDSVHRPGQVVRWSGDQVDLYA